MLPSNGGRPHPTTLNNSPRQSNVRRGISNVNQPPQAPQTLPLTRNPGPTTFRAPAQRVAPSSAANQISQNCFVELSKMRLEIMAKHNIMYPASVATDTNLKHIVSDSITCKLHLYQCIFSRPKNFL